MVNTNQHLIYPVGGANLVSLDLCNLLLYLVLDGDALAIFGGVLSQLGRVDGEREARADGWSSRGRWPYRGCKGRGSRVGVHGAGAVVVVAAPCVGGIRSASSKGGVGGVGDGGGEMVAVANRCRRCRRQGWDARLTLSSWFSLALSFWWIWPLWWWCWWWGALRYRG